MISSNIKVLFYQLNFLSDEFIIQNYFFFLVLIPLFLIALFLLFWKSKKKLDNKITKDENSFSSETKTKNTFLHPDQNLGKLEHGKVYESETFLSYDSINKTDKFIIIHKDNE